MKSRMIDYYMSLADTTAKLSRAEKLKVGAVIVTTDDAILYGWNGQPAGWDNQCEFVLEDGSLETYPSVLHAEMNCLSKLAKSTLSGRGASLFLTHSPCINCAKAVYQSGIIQVYYRHDYRCTEGVQFLKWCGTEVLKIEDNNRGING